MDRARSDGGTSFTAIVLPIGDAVASHKADASIVPGTYFFPAVAFQVANLYNHLDIEIQYQPLAWPRQMSLVSPETVPIQCLRVGETAFVEAVCGELNHVQRLRELGFADGARLEMLQPGSPCIVRLAGQRLCFRADGITSILVRTGAAD